MLNKMADDFISDEDKALFREHMRSVKPLKEKNLRLKPVRTRSPIPPKKCPAPEMEQQKKYYLSDTIINEVLSHTTLSYAQSSLSQQRFKALKNGHISWEARLDLHGLAREKAEDALCRFIHFQAQNNTRCLLVIHGKGGREGTPPLIKNLVNRWLPQMDEVLAFHSALPKDGGTGAVYVLLKKNKDNKKF
jgi:DNA-nicking Smr family endonuclease